MVTSSQLIELIKEYDPDVNEDLLRRAYIFSMEAHGTQKRESGAPYFSHPVGVAIILIEMKMDVATIVTGLLHDVLEDTDVSVEQLTECFGTEIVSLVEGVTKLNKVKYVSKKEHQAENFRKFLLAISQDIRVLLVKLADRLHNMRTLNHVASIEKRKRIALESLDIYAPLADRIGMQNIKDEIEDISFFMLYPQEYGSIIARLESIKRNNVNFVENTIADFKDLFEKRMLNVKIYGREKKPYSIWQKMYKRNIPLEQINDIIAFRIIVNTVEDCYKALGIIHTSFPIIPGRFKDYISIPKFNNYRSLHTTVVGSRQQRIEIQIRTNEMHEIADVGYASHWSYKSGEIGEAKGMREYQWIKNLLSVAENSSNPEEVMEHSKMEMFENEVFCFTPNGDLIIMPRGTTAIDFAYAIHTSVGNTCIGARINGTVMALKTKLHNGDQVEVLTSPFQRPEAEWNEIVVTGKARSCIKKFIRSQERAEFITLGMLLARYVFESSGVEFSEENIQYTNYECDSLENFYYNLARDEISIEKFHEEISKSGSVTYNNPTLCILSLIPGVAVHYSQCCHPMQDDKVIGVITKSKGLTIHTTTCDTIGSDDIGKLIALRWNDDADQDKSFIARLRVVLINKTGSLAILSSTISNHGADIANLKIEHRSIDFADIIVDIHVNDIKHLNEIQASLRTNSIVKNVRRL